MALKYRKNGSIKRECKKTFYFLMHPRVHQTPQIWQNYIWPKFEIFDMVFFPVSFISFDPLVLSISLRSKKRLRIVSALKCGHLELCTGKNRKSGAIFVNTARVNFCISMPLDFSSRAPPLNLKILKNHYYGVKIQKKWLHQTRVQKNFLFFDAP